jgi:hypothetical protein
VDREDSHDEEVPDVDIGEDFDQPKVMDLDMMDTSKAPAIEM